MTDSRKLKILLLGDYSNCHRTLRDALRRLGHEVTLVSDGCRFQDTDRDIDVSRDKGRVGGIKLMLKLLSMRRGVLSDNDVVVLQNPHFVDLAPRRLRYLFDRLRGDNATVWLNAAGTDCAYISACLSDDYPLSYSEFSVGGKPAPFALAHPKFVSGWTAPALRRYNDHVYNHVDGIATSLYEYDVAVRHYLGDSTLPIEYCGIPIDTRALSPVTLADPSDGVRLFLGRHRDRQVEKGTDLLEQAARIVMDRHPGRCSLDVVENLPYDQYVQRQTSAHVVLDQIYSYSPATNAMIAMARGLNVVSGGEPEFYDFIGERDNRPIINAPTDLDALIETLDAVVSDPDAIAGRGRRSHEFVVKHNDSEVVARRFIDLWTKKL